MTESPYPVSLDDGWIAAGLAEEFPDLKLRTLAVPCVPGASPTGLRQQLAYVSDRMTGAKAIKLRRDPVPSAYRVFYRLVGLDPDQTLTPVEQAALDRLFHGDYRAGGLVEDALLLAERAEIWRWGSRAKGAVRPLPGIAGDASKGNVGGGFQMGSYWTRSRQAAVL